MTPQLVRIITNLKEKNLNGMGLLQLAQDLSELADMERIDLSGMVSLQGTASSRVILLEAVTRMCLVELL